jgi:hypothetical protein
MRRRPIVLVELGLVEQRYHAVREVLNDGALVTDVARRRGVSRQTVHVPGRTSIYRCLVRHGLITPQAHRRTRADYR